MKKMTKSLILTGALTLSLPVLAFKGGMGNCQGNDPAERLDRMTAKLELTEAQQAKIKPILEAQSEKRSSMGARGEIMKELKTAIHAGASDAEISAIADKAANKAREHVLMKAETMGAIHDVLTPEQREKMSKMQKRGCKWKKGREQ